MPGIDDPSTWPASTRPTVQTRPPATCLSVNVRTGVCSAPHTLGDLRAAGPFLQGPAGAPPDEEPDLRPEQATSRGRSSTHGRLRCSRPAPVAASRPAVNSSESPGRKNPIRSPVSANNTTNTPRVPNDDNRSFALSGFRASTVFTVLLGLRPGRTVVSTVGRGLPFST